MKYFDKLNAKENIKRARRKKTKEKLNSQFNKEDLYYDLGIKFGFISLDDSKNQEYLDNLVYQRYLKDEYEGGTY